jgi:hypothetical protein
MKTVPATVSQLRIQHTPEPDRFNLIRCARFSQHGHTLNIDIHDSRIPYKLLDNFFLQRRNKLLRNLWILTTTSLRHSDTHQLMCRARRTERMMGGTEFGVVLALDDFLPCKNRIAGRSINKIQVIVWQTLQLPHDNRRFALQIWYRTDAAKRSSDKDRDGVSYTLKKAHVNVHPG